VKILLQSKHTGFSIQMDGSHPYKLTIFQALRRKNSHINLNQ
jgi:hypothetical protein